MQTQKRNKKLAYLLTPIALAATQLFGITAYAEEAKLTPVEVVATTPLAGIGIPKEQIAANVQTATGQQIEDSGAVNIADYMNKNMSGVHVNDNQGNPFQVDLNYRGFTASPLLGTPQGISVYMDGVRMNQPFGDIVQWDLIPKSAIKNMTLIPGSNPLFGLNTLGGAISIQTKDGLSYQGTEVEAGIGSYGRYSTEFETGGKNDNGLNWYVNATRWGEDGWRDSSPSGITQLFSKLGWKSRDTDLKLTYALANSNLTGNGLQQKELLDSNYKSVFTKPDQTHNNANFLNLEGKHSINENTIFTGNAYYRKTNTHTFNGDLNEAALGQSVYYSGETTASRYSNAYIFPNGTQCTNMIANNGETNEKCTGLLTTTNTSQKNYGLSGQLNFLNDLVIGKNNLILGGGYDASRMRFTQSSQFGYLNQDRSITAINSFADGTQDSENTFDNRVDLSGKVVNWSTFFSDTLSVKNEMFHISTAARYNSTKINNLDNITPTGPYSYPTYLSGNSGDNRNSLTGNHSYSRLNPSVGVSFTPVKTFNSYLSYSEASRAPSPIELGCADPAYPCRLPNAMAGDPPLKQVVAKTWQAGARGLLPESQIAWSTNLFNTNLNDDIQFISTNASGGGYFANFEQTRRRGLELSLSGKADKKLAYWASYTYLKATYQSEADIQSPYNSQADADGNIKVQKGNVIPLMPQHHLKLNLAYAYDDKWTIGLGMTAVSSSYAQGNQNNAQKTGVRNLGVCESNGAPVNCTNAALASPYNYSGYVLSNPSADGKVPGYAIFDLRSSYKFDPQLSIQGSILNLFDTRHYTAGALGPYAFTSSGYTNGGYQQCSGGAVTTKTHDGACVSSGMLAPGAPRTFWVSMRYTFDKPRKD